MQTNEKKSFILYTNFYNQFELLDVEQRGELITAIFLYVKTGTAPELSGMTKMAFSYIKDTLDRDREVYEARCEKNRENGKRGGRPKKDLISSKTEWFFQKPKKPDNDNDNDNGNENENVNDIDNDNGSGNENVNEESIAPLSLCASSNATTTPPSREKQEIFREELIEEGIPERYIEEVAQRAEYYASKRGVGVYELIREWWQSDRQNPKWQSKDGASRASHEHDSEIEEWFEQRLRLFYGDGG